MRNKFVKSYLSCIYANLVKKIKKTEQWFYTAKNSLTYYFLIEQRR